MLQAPDPSGVHNIAEFIDRLRLLKVWAGDPSITQITRRVRRAWQLAGRPESEWPARSTIGSCFQAGRRRVNVDLLIAVVHALVDGDPAMVGVWHQALRSIQADLHAANCVAAFDRLPADSAGFVGRAAQLDQVAGLLRSTRPIVSLVGMPGVGKTAMAVKLGHQLLGGGLNAGPVLFVNLRGNSADRPPAAPAAVLESFLHILGVPPDLIPSSLPGRTALYQQRLQGKAALVVLDDAADEEQIRLLLPKAPRCVTLITSRRMFRGLTEVAHVSLPVLSPPDALELLRHAATGQRIDSDRETAEQIAALVGHLPLALSILGRHIREHPGWRLTDYYPQPATSLAMEGGVGAALAASDRSLPADAQRLLRLLALHPDREFDVHAASALDNHRVEVTQEHLDVLVEAHLVGLGPSGGHRLHRLVLAYARSRVGIDKPPSRIQQARTRLFDHYADRGFDILAVLAFGEDRGQSSPNTSIHTASTLAPAGVV